MRVSGYADAWLDIFPCFLIPERVYVLSALDLRDRGCVFDPLRNTTSMKTIYQQLKEIVSNNSHLLTAYQTDLTVHDLSALRQSRSGEVYVWGLREHGTQMTPVPNACKWANSFPKLADKEKAWEWNQGWIASIAKNHPETLWFKLTLTGKNQGIVEPISSNDAIALLKWKSDISSVFAHKQK
jgi:hypothetical protein